MVLQLDTDLGLGDNVRDEVTGYEGYIVGIAFHITGCTRYGVRANTGNTGSRSEEEWFSGAQLERTTEEPIEAQTVTSSEIELGAHVRDTLTDVEGYVTTVTFNLYNCPRAAVTLLPDGKNDEVNREWVDIPRLDLIDEGVGEDYESLTENDNEGETGASGENISRVQNRG